MQKFLSFITCLLLTALLCSCNQPPSPSQPVPPPSSVKHAHQEVKKEEPVKSAKPHYDMDAYVKQLSMAQLLLARDSEDIRSVITELETIQVFSAQTHRPEIKQPVVIITYRIKGSKETRQLVVPFRISQDNDFPELNDILFQLNGIKLVMEDIHPAMLSNLPARNLMFPINEPQKVKVIIDNELSLLLLTRTSFMPVEEAKVQIRLLKFFLEHRIRDAAYLTDENAAQSLAEAENSGGDSATIEMLSDELDMLESRLHKELPFTLNIMKALP